MSMPQGMLNRSKSVTSRTAPTLVRHSVSTVDFWELRLRSFAGKRGEPLSGLALVVVESGVASVGVAVVLAALPSGGFAPSVKFDSNVSKLVSQRQTMGGSNQMTESGKLFM